MTTPVPAQVDLAVPASAITAGLSVSVIESTEEHPETLSVTVTKYLIVLATFEVRVGFATAVLLRRVEGDQL
jgi:hypothetical protein